MTPDARLLRTLRQGSPIGPVSPSPILPSELGRMTGLEPQVIAERIAGMNAAGYEIELSPHHGYRLVATPDRLIADDIAARLSLLEGERGECHERHERRIGREIVVLEETASTNDVATHFARSGAAEGVVIFAERQTAGRGRLGRKWDSAARAGLWFSILLRPERINLPQQSWAQLTTWAAVGVARALDESLRKAAMRAGRGATTLRAGIGGSIAGIKWPNDIYLNGRKAVGILTESGSNTPSGGYAIAGIGVNVNQLSFPEELGNKATSLRLAQEQMDGEQPSPPSPLDRMEVATALLHHLDTLYNTLATSGFAPILQEAERRSLLLGEWIDVQTPGGMIQGMAEGLNPDGTLRLRRSDGSMENLSGGEVSVARWK